MLFINIFGALHLKAYKTMNKKNIRTIAIVSGKGGVGKSSITLNLAQALSRRGKQVSVLDADFSLANLHVLLGKDADKNIANVLSQQCSIQDILLKGPDHINIIPGARGMPVLASIEKKILLGLIQSVDSLSDSTDIFLMDTAGGMTNGELQLVSACQEIILVITPSLMSIDDAITYARQLNRRYRVDRFKIVTNMVKGQRQSAKLMEIFQNRLGFDCSIVLEYFGHITFDLLMQKACNQSTTALSGYPESRVTKEIIQLADTILKDSEQHFSTGGIEFFLENHITSGD